MFWMIFVIDIHMRGVRLIDRFRQPMERTGEQFWRLVAFKLESHVSMLTSDRRSRTLFQQPRRFARPP
jgi:hypothetical protein